MLKLSNKVRLLPTKGEYKFYSFVTLVGLKVIVSQCCISSGSTRGVRGGAVELGGHVQGQHFEPLTT